MDAYQIATTLYEQLVQLEPGNNVLHANRSAILLRLGRADQALHSAEKALQLEPNWAKVFLVSEAGKLFFAV